jgi:hypothetical protein
MYLANMKTDSSASTPEEGIERWVLSWVHGGAERLAGAAPKPGQGRQAASLLDERASLHQTSS